MRIRFELTGLMPFLMHRDDVEACDILLAWRKDPKNKGISVRGDDRSPAWTWQTYLHHDGNNVSIPSDMLMACLKKAAAQMYIKGQKTFKEVSQSGMGVVSEYFEFMNGANRAHLSILAIHDLREKSFAEQSDAVRGMGFRLFVKRAAVGKAKHIRVRPRFDVWSATGEVVVVAPELTFEVVTQLFELAGSCGLGDWRPACKTPGPFGIFSAKLSLSN